MRTRTVFGALLILTLGFAGWSCKKNHSRPNRVYGTLVISGPCANYVIRVDSGYIDPALVTVSWTTADTTYNNVFAVKNVCAFSNHNFKQGQALSFFVNDSTFTNDCMICAIAHQDPPNFNVVSDIFPLP